MFMFMLIAVWDRFGMVVGCFWYRLRGGFGMVLVAIVLIYIYIYTDIVYSQSRHVGSGQHSANDE
jgi:hypothetical protein